MKHWLLVLSLLLLGQTTPMVEAAEELVSPVHTDPETVDSVPESPAVMEDNPPLPADDWDGLGSDWGA